MNSAESAPNPWIRETIDSFGVALILAFLFRAFVAEAFVIPTGSMAPTLMGAHKDVVCSQCGMPYQTAASNEYNASTGETTNVVVIGTTCPLCRFQQPIELNKDENQATFSGDRILVSKLAYIQSDPERWQVFVFKNPTAARENFIKRLVGLPNETLRVQHGDIYVKPDGDGAQFEIARKPPSIVEVHLQPLNNTNHRPTKAIAAGLPSPWQPEGPIPNAGAAGTPSPEAGNWKVTNTETEWSAAFEGSGQANANSVGGFEWLRYYHYTLKPWQWYSINKSAQIVPAVLPRSSQLINDFTHYNGRILTARSEMYEGPGLTVLRDYKVSTSPFKMDIEPWNDSKINPNGADGMNWTSDLAAEYDIQLASDSGVLAFDLVEAGVHYVLQINTADGKAQVQAMQGGVAQAVFLDANKTRLDKITADTAVRGKSNVRVKYANVDNTIHLWVNGTYVDFQPSNQFDPTAVPNGGDNRPQFSPNDSGDAAPIGVAFGGGLQGTVSHIQVWRDIYYTAVSYEIGSNDTYADYPVSQLNRYVSDSAVQSYRNTLSADVVTRDFDDYVDEYRNPMRRSLFFEQPSLWANSDLFASRRVVQFHLDADQYFPMGDNTVESSDGRLWEFGYVHRDLLIGRAGLVFWPHPWNSPIKYFPNFKRMGIIR